MFNTLRVKLLIINVGLLLSTVILLNIVTHIEIKKTITKAQDENARNVVNTVLLNVENQYKSIIYNKKTLLKKRKAELKNVILIAFSVIEQINNKYEKGELTLEQAKKSAVEYIKKMRYDNGVGYIWINGTQAPVPMMIMHPTLPNLDGKLMNSHLYNIARKDGVNLGTVIRSVCLKSGEGYIDYKWPKPAKKGLLKDQPKISYVKLFEKWNWILGTGVYTDDIERESQERITAVIKELQHTSQKVKIAGMGYLAIFNGKNQLIIHPHYSGAAFTTAINPETGNLLLEDLKKASKTKEKLMNYTWDKPPEYKGKKIFKKRAYVCHYKPLDWYIVATAYLEDIEQPVYNLTRKRILWTLPLVFLSILFLVLLSFNVTNPLKNLTYAINKIRNEGVLASKSIPISGTIETRNLGKFLKKMMKSIQNNVEEKENLLKTIKINLNKLEIVNENLKEEVVDRKIAQGELQKSESKFSLAFESSPYIMAIISLVNGKYININEKFTKNLGYFREEVIGKTINSIDIFQNPSDFTKITQIINNSKKVKDFEFQLKTKAGKIRTVMLSTEFIEIENRSAALIVVNDITQRKLVEKKLASANIELTTHRDHLEELVNKKTLQLKQVQAELIDNAHKAGQADIATSVLHNVGNILNSVSISSELVKQHLQKSEIKKLEMANVLMKENMDNIENFILKDPKGKQLLNYYIQIEDVLVKENLSILKNVKRLTDKIDVIKNVIFAQQAYASGESLSETLQLSEIIEDALIIQENFIKTHNIAIERDFDLIPPVVIQKTKFIHIIINLLKNSYEAMIKNSIDNREIKIVLRKEKEFICMKFEDNGAGISDENLGKVFQHGFTTKKDGHGFGLHSCVNYISEMGGKLFVESDGEGKGSVFIIHLDL
jgi:two-component system, NtrC family, sensor kinase